MLKDKIVDYLKVQTAFFDFDSLNNTFTAEKIAEHFEIKRNTVSHHLMSAFQEDKIIKLNTRPVYFLHKEAFESQFYSVDKTIFSSISDLKSEKPKFNRKENLFSLIIGHDNSLSRSIEQLKTAAFYPKGELPFIITGESGTGKSYMVKIYHQFCIEEGLIPDEAPFVIFNCAQYADNPELLTSNLFGYKKGAFTGASSDQKGVFDSAQDGILFLDEVHRLSPEGQEKLFTYLDEKLIYPVGETNNGHKVSVRLAFATTEDLSSTFLTTFLRRIPIQIELPSLNERSNMERQELIYSFIIHESRKINKPISVSPTIINLLKGQSFKGNIGELKNIIKYAVARSFSRQSEAITLSLTVFDLPANSIGPVTALTIPTEEDTYIFDKDTNIMNLKFKRSSKQKAIVYTYNELLSIYDAGGTVSWEKMEKLVDTLLDTLFFDTKSQTNQELFRFITEFVKEVLKKMEEVHRIKFEGNSVYTISYYLFYRNNIHWECDSDKIVKQMDQLSHEASTRFGSSYQLASNVLDLIAKKLDLEIFEMDIIIFTLYFNKMSIVKTSSYSKGIIIAHGYSTASSIANVANRMLDMTIFESFDMPLETSPTEITNQVIKYVQTVDISNGLVILVDMGSLNDIYKALDTIITAPVVILNNVTTQIALSVGEGIKNKIPIDKMADKIIEENKLTYEIVYPMVEKPKAIISSCFTGIGTARKIMGLLEKSLPNELGITVLSYEFDKLKNDIVKLQSLYDILGVVGTSDPNLVDITFISIDDIIIGKGLEKMSILFGKNINEEQLIHINNQLIKNFSLETVINSVTILDTEKIIEKIELFIGYFENLENINIDDSKKISIYVHVSCLVERLIRNEAITTYKDIDLLKQCHEETLKNIKEAFSVIEEYYSVIIPDEEIGYIHNLIFLNTDVSMIDNSF